MHKNNSIKVTISIPTNNRLKDLNNCLFSLATQSCQNFTVLIVNNSKNSINEITEKFPNLNIEIIQDLSKSGPKVFNTCWKQADTEYVAFINDDAIANPKWVENIYRHINNSEAVFGGPAITKNGHQILVETFRNSNKDLFSKVKYNILNFILFDGKFAEIGLLTDSITYSIGGALETSRDFPEIIQVQMLSLTNLVISRNLLEDTGGFDEKYIFTHHDGQFFIDLNKKGYKLIFDPALWVDHYPNPSGLTRDEYFRGVDFGRFYKKNIQLSGKKYKVYLNILILISFFFARGLVSFSIKPMRGIHGIYAGYFSDN